METGLDPAELACELLQAPEHDEGRDDGRDSRDHIGACRFDGSRDAGRQGGMGRAGGGQYKGRDQGQTGRDFLGHG